MYTCLKTDCTRLEFASSGTCGNKICTFDLYMLNPFYEYLSVPIYEINAEVKLVWEPNYEYLKVAFHH
jgi:hypothetical protein